MNDQAKKRFPRWAKITLIVLAAILLLIMLCVIGIALYLNAMLDKIDYVQHHTTLSSEEASSIAQEEWETIPTDDTTPIEEDVTVPTTPTEPEVPVEQGEHIVNILLIGQDRRPGEGTQRSDSMILVTFNRSTKAITLTSIMRDQYVNIPGYGNDKLCHAYQYGGMPLLDQTLYDHFGIQVDGNIEVDFSGFESIIDLLGGVDVDLTEKEAEYLYWEYGLTLDPGPNHLCGKDALVYARIRGLDNDYNRAGRQRKVLLSLVERYKDQDLATMLSLMDQLLPLVTTDIPKSQLISYALELFPMLDGATIQTLRIPADGTFKGGYIKVSANHRMWVQYNIDFEANRRLLQQIFAA